MLVLERATAMKLWTGVACLVADPNCKEFRRFGDDGKRAYVNIVAWACSKEEFEQRIKQTGKAIDCILLELEHIQLLDERLEDPEWPEELRCVPRHNASRLSRVRPP